MILLQQYYEFMGVSLHCHHLTIPSQGNVHCVVRHDGTLVESNEYYPYGTPFTTAGAVQPYKYGTKELDRMHGLDLYDSEARWYDSLLGRTSTMDPKSEKYYSLSPYLWCAGNPVRFIDPSGKDIVVYDENGELIHHIKTDNINLVYKYLKLITVTESSTAIAGVSTSFDGTSKNDNTIELQRESNISQEEIGIDNPAECSDTKSASEKAGLVINGAATVLSHETEVIEKVSGTILPSIKSAGLALGIAGTIIGTSDAVVNDYINGKSGRATMRILVNGIIGFIGYYNPFCGYSLSLIENKYGELLYNNINY